MEKTKSVLKSSSRVIIIGIIIVVLIFLSFLMVSVVPKVLSSMANATVSVTSAFFPADNSKNTNSTTNTSTSSGVTLNSPTTTTSTTSDSGNFLTSFFGPRKTDNSNNGTPATFVVATSSRQNSNSYNNQSSNQTNNQRTYNDRNTNQRTGTPDLAVQITSVGVSSSNGSFVATNNFTTSDTVVVKFTIQNIGTGPSGAWSMKVNMPSSNASDQVRAISSNSLTAGAAVSGQAVFNTPALGSNQKITVSVDPNGYILESSKNNNQASVTINVTQDNSYNNSYNNGYNNNYNNCVNGYTNGVYTNCNNNNNYYNNNYNCINGYTNGIYTNCNNNYGYGTGLPNLSANFIALGKIDTYNQFTQTTYLRTIDRVAMKFTVTNNSSVYTSSWTWKATLIGPNPYYNTTYYNNNYGYNTNGYIYNSDGSRTYIPTIAESGLAPGETRTYTATFDSPNPGSSTMTIVIDPSNNITESNEGDNTISQSFFVNY